MDRAIIETEIKLKAVRSSGAGGQNVNKVSSKVVLFFHIQNSNGLNEEEKEILTKKLAKKISQEGFFQVTAEEDRSQLKNKSIVVQKLFETLEKALVKPKPRKATKIPKGVVEKRIKEKKTNSEIKNSRKKLNL